MIPVLRPLTQCVNRFARRSYASSAKLVEITRRENTDVSVVSMARAPVNGLNLELLVELRKAFEEVQSNGSKGLILTSSLQTIFSGGLDIMEMYKPDLKRCTEFWTALQDTWSTLYGLGMPTAAAINGASPAGGCLLAISCEYRAFVEGKHTMGLNETKLGIVAPRWFQMVYISTIGYRQAEEALLKGTLFTPQEALSIGLVDELAKDKEDAIAKCEQYISSFASIPSEGRQATKLALRSDALSWLKKNRELDINVFLNFIKSPKVQAGLDFYIKSLKQKRG